MKDLVKLAVIAFSIGLGVVVGNRLSAEAVAVVVGVVGGALASIPTSLLLLALTRRWTRTEEPRPQPSAYPPVVVIQPGTQPQNHALPPFLPPAPMTVASRQFRVIGEEEQLW